MSLQLNDQFSASSDLYLLLRCEHSLFDSRVHEIAVQRLSAIQQARTAATINWDKLFENEVRHSPVESAKTLKHMQSTSQVDVVVQAPEIVAGNLSEMAVQTCEDNVVSDNVESDSRTSELPEMERFRCCVM